MRWWLAGVLVWFGIGFGPLAGRAQDQPAADRDTERIKSSRLDTVYLKREDGTLVPFFDIPFEVFEEIYDRYIGAEQESLPEAYTLERLDGKGTIQRSVDGEVAELSLTMRIVPHRSGWVRVPLNLSNATVTGWDAGERRSDVLLGLDTDRSYVAWVKGGAAGPVDVELKIVRRIEVQSGQATLSLALPTATLAQLTLELPLSDPEVSVASERLLPRIDPLPEDRSLLSVSGPSGPLELRWRPRELEATSGLSVVTDVTIQVDGPELVRYQATLDVASLNGLDRGLLVRLPRGARFDAADQLELQVEALEPNDPRLEGTDSADRYVAVTFAQPLDKPTRIVLFASRSAAVGEQTGSEVALGGFEVLRAVRQSGSLLLIGSRDWRIDWNAGDFLRQVSLLPADRAREGAVARFQFTRAPAELTARIVRNESRIACEPMLDVVFSRDRMQIEAAFRYAFSGPRPESLWIETRGEQPDFSTLRTRPGIRDVVEDGTTPGRWRIDLDPAFTDESLELRFTVSRPMERFGDVSVPLPLPVASTVSAAMVTLRASDELEVTPRLSPVQGTILPGNSDEVNGASLLEGMTPRGTEARGAGSSATGSATDAGSVGLPLVAPPLGSVRTVRIQSLADVPALDCRVTVRPQRVEVVSDIAVRLDAGRALITQTLDYQVRYVPMEGGWLAVDRSVLETGQLTLRVDGQPLGFRPVVSPLTALDPRWRVVQFELPRPLAGPFRLEAVHEAAVAGGSVERPTPFELSLIVPLQLPDGRTRFWGTGILGATEWLAVQPIGDLARRVEVDLPADRVLLSVDDRWRMEPSAERGERRLVVLSKLDREPVRRLAWQLGIGEGASAQGSRISKAWVQTLVTPEYRRDRVCLRVVGTRPTLELRLPTELTLQTVAVDGVEMSGASSQVVGDQLSVPLSQESAEKEWVIELWFRGARNRAVDRRLALVMPEAMGVDWIEQLYWELVLPPDETLLVEPQRLVSENIGSWSGLNWVESPRLSTAQLEQWVGATAQATPSTVFHRRLYVGFGERVQGEVWVARRWEVAAAGSAFWFLCGATFVVFRLDRRPIWGLGIAALAFVLAAGLPQVAIWAVRLGVVVSLFVMVSAYLRWLWGRPVRRVVTRGSVTPDRSASRALESSLDRSSTRARLPIDEMATTHAPGEPVP